MPKTLLAVVVLLLAGPPLAAADDLPIPDRSEKTAAWKHSLLAPGRGWWCRRDRCVRDREFCEAAGACVRQKRAWAFSFVAWGTRDPKWLVTAWSTRSLCEERHEAFLADDDATSISACTSVGDKRAPAEPDRKRAVLPRGKGWWCFRFKNPILGTDTSTCERTKAHCTRGIARLSSPQYREVLGGIETTAGCRRVKAAWASEVGGPDPMFMIFDSEADCQANMIGGPCNRVR